MAKRMILVLFVTVLLLGTLGFMKFRQVKSAIAHASFQPPPDAVTSVVVGQAHWPSTMSVIGTMEAVQGVMVSADLPGTVEKINFDSGNACGKATFWLSSTPGKSARNSPPWKRNAIWQSLTTPACRNW